VALSLPPVRRTARPPSPPSPAPRPRAPAASRPPSSAARPEARARDASARSTRPSRSTRSARALKGFRQAIVDGQVFYVSDDGKYLMQGSLFERWPRAKTWARPPWRPAHEAAGDRPGPERIVFAPPNPKYTVSVFTDVECGYCRKFHSEIAEYNRQGIAVQYLAFPRMGLGSDGLPQDGLGLVRARPQQGPHRRQERPPPAPNELQEPVTMEYDVGRRVGLTGTPMILAADGTELGGYLPPDKLRPPWTSWPPARRWRSPAPRRGRGHGRQRRGGRDAVWEAGEPGRMPGPFQRSLSR
jgi:thiol:disulfide interchange protein DsbC